MAHEEHNINWNILAANLFHRSSSYPAADTVSNLYFQFKPTQGQEIDSFIESFVRTLEKHTQDERHNYPDRYSPFTPDELVLNDHVAEQIRPLAHRWCKAYNWPLNDKIQKTEGLCRHVNSESFACGCSLPYHERKGADFQRPYPHNAYYHFVVKNTEVLYNLQVLNALLVLGEMDTVLRLCATPDNNLQKSMFVPSCPYRSPDLGWDQVFEGALNIYLLLNILYCFPELWDPASRQARNKKRTDEYRATRMYRQTVKIWTHDGSETKSPATLTGNFSAWRAISATRYTSRAVETGLSLPSCARNWKGTAGGRSPRQNKSRRSPYTTNLSSTANCLSRSSWLAGSGEPPAASIRPKGRSTWRGLKRIFGRQGCRRSWYCRSRPAQTTAAFGPLLADFGPLQYAGAGTGHRDRLGEPGARGAGRHGVESGGLFGLDAHESGEFDRRR
ncbi:hypothetical protein Aspvir_006835 [Aspergillus viridinutans]|uniref:Uncharacterized protein n=1 Tax=Aspergillus viridinutans TaxID=75553 RepID=A0A9P3F2P4_ASPVI|nr:uncharacterized protein Aspvir_006835 [Aspergillus viridinutans]GIK02774.1 hypothetical protein Aspvir_006835 [Aspergillus viridinutans]